MSLNHDTFACCFIGVAGNDNTLLLDDLDCSTTIILNQAYVSVNINAYWDNCLLDSCFLTSLRSSFIFWLTHPLPTRMTTMNQNPLPMMTVIRPFVVSLKPMNLHPHESHQPILCEGRDPLFQRKVQKAVSMKYIHGCSWLYLCST